jgi:hypothetical protein
VSDENLESIKELDNIFRSGGMVNLILISGDIENPPKIEIFVVCKMASQNLKIGTN